jgi:UDP-N-acetylmuramyl-tripeptide synthetase
VNDVSRRPSEAGRVNACLALDDVVDAVVWLRAQGVRRLVSDSRQLQPGDAFLAWPGTRDDARRFLAQAAQAGVACALIESQDAEPWLVSAQDALQDGTARLPPVATLPSLKWLAGPLADLWWGQPSQQLDVLAVTGTNGKTSTSWWLAQSLSAVGRRCGVAGTLGVGLLPALDTTGLTTPDALSLQHCLARLGAQGAVACAMEASSIGLVEGRLNGTQIRVALFSNFTQDHLDYHGSMQAYWEAKRRLFAWSGLRAAVLNVGDARLAALAQELAESTHALAALDLWTVRQHPGPGALPAARLVAHEVVHAADGLRFQVTESGAGGGTVSVKTPIIGAFNVDNLLLVLGGLRALGVGLAQAASALAGLYPVPGRLQRVPLPAAKAAGETPGPEVVVDYAHTPDALDKVLHSLRPWAQQRAGRLWCVFGCGGDRDPVKRPLMGRVAVDGADCVILTSDNPRSEDPQHILKGIVAGVPAAQRASVAVQEDRRKAIAHAIAEAASNDVVLVAGKGHEDYQEVRGQRLPFSDVAVAAECLTQRLAERVVGVRP